MRKCANCSRLYVRRRLLPWLAGAVAVAAMPALTSAVPIYDSGGFEPPTFVLGVLEGQDPGAGPWLRTGTFGTAVVQNAKVRSGLQAVQVDRAPDEDTRWGVLKTVENVTAPIVIEWDMNVLEQTDPFVPFGPYFAVEAFDAHDNPILLIGSAGMDATTGEFLFQEGGTGFLTPTGDILSFDTWYHFEMLLDYGSQEYSVYLDGEHFVTTGFVDPGIDDFTDAPIAALAGSFDPDSFAATGTAYFDNFHVAIIPEPISMVAFALGGLALFTYYATRRRSVLGHMVHRQVPANGPLYETD